MLINEALTGAVVHIEVLGDQDNEWSLHIMNRSQEQIRVILDYLSIPYVKPGDPAYLPLPEKP
jgi:hypothetical protein